MLHCAVNVADIAIVSENNLILNFVNKLFKISATYLEPRQWLTVIYPKFKSVGFKILKLLCFESHFNYSWHSLQIFCKTFFTAGGLFEGGLFDDAPMGEVPPVDASIPEPTPQDIPPPPDSDDDDMDNFGGPPSIGDG